MKSGPYQAAFCPRRDDSGGSGNRVHSLQVDGADGGNLLERLKAWWEREFGRGQPAEMETVSLLPQELMVHDVETPDRYKIWIDSVGVFLLYPMPRVTIGGPGRAENAADISLLANLSRRHATIVRGSEGYVLEAHAPVKVADRLIEDVTPLNNNYDIELGEGVRLKFRLPSVLSATAVLDFVSDHRPSQSVDGVVLLDETCLLGPGRENHIRCPEWNESVLMFRKEGTFWCKSQSDLVIGGKIVKESGPIEPGEVVSGLDLQFRIEKVA